MVHPAEGWGLEAASTGRPGDGNVGIGGRDLPRRGQETHSLGERRIRDGWVREPKQLGNRLAEIRKEIQSWRGDDAEMGAQGP